MRQLSDILMRLPSYVLHPFWLPTYGMLLLMLGCFQNLHTSFVLWACIGTFTLTAIIPLLISILYVSNTSDSLEMTDRNNRIAPYIYTSVCYTFWCYFLTNALSMPPFIMAPAIGATLTLVLITIITIWWKISAHMTGIGGLIGSMLAVCRSLTIMPISFVITAFFIAVLLAWSRTYMKAHTPQELSAGFIMGLLCTYYPSLLI